MGCYIQNTVDDFLNNLEVAKIKLENISVSISNREDEFFRAVDSLTQKIQLEKNKAITINSFEDNIQEKLSQSLQGFENLLTSWIACIKQVKKGQQFINENEKHMLVMVFGQVKTGKSSLGNFLAGKSFVNAPFDNKYKSYYHNNLTRPVFKIVEQGRDGNLDGEWFAEGETDTTGAIQHFTIGGLRWLDSPGTGALAKSGDTINMEHLVKEYIDFTDLGVFLMSSDEPGLQSDFKYIKMLQERNKQALVLITKSDFNDEFEQDGTIVAKYIAKPQKNRDEQECWIRSQIEENGASEKFNVMSLSTYLAQHAMVTQNTDLFKQSGMDQFMCLLGKIVEEDVIAIKEKNPKDNINNLIQDIITGVNDTKRGLMFDGVNYLTGSFNQIMGSIGEYKLQLSKLKEPAIQNSKNRVRAFIVAELQQQAIRLEKNARSIQTDNIASSISMHICKVITEELDDKIKDILANFDNKQLDIKSSFQLNIPLEKETEQICQKTVSYDKVEREANSLLEKCGKFFFNKKYYGSQENINVHYINVDAGTNVGAVIEDACKVVDQEIEMTINSEINRLENEYFAVQEHYVRNVLVALVEFEKELLGLKFKS